MTASLFVPINILFDFIQLLSTRCYDYGHSMDRKITVQMRDVNVIQRKCRGPHT